MKCNENLSKIANYLILNGSYMKDISLFHGKCGVLLSLYLHGQKYQNAEVCKYAEELLYDVCKQIHDGLPVGIEFGYSGIALSITFLTKLSKKKYDLNDILHDIDERIMTFDPRRLSDVTFRKGSAGVMYYIEMRMRNKTKLTSIDQVYIADLRHQLSSKAPHKENSYELLDEIKQPFFEPTQYIYHRIGIDEGSAYYLFKDSYDQILYN